MYKIDTSVMRAVDTTKEQIGKIHLARVSPIKPKTAVEPRTLCGRTTYGEHAMVLTKVVYLGAVMTPPCDLCLRKAIKEAPDAIREV